MPPDDRSRPTPQQGDSQNLIQDQGTTDGDTSARGQVTPTDPTLAPSLDLLAQFAEPATCLDQALAYAAQGVPVFPLKAGAKTPATPHGFKDATTDPEQIRAWWAKWPDANIGMPTGQASGRIVLDPDNGPAGLQALAQLQAEIGALPPTLTVRTPGDKAQGKEPGLHLHLAHPGGKVKNSAGKLGDALDVRGDGGYVVLPPSTLTDGPYTVETDAPVAELPDAWAGLLRNGTRETPKPAQDRGRGRFVLASKPARSFTHAEALDYLTEQALIPLRKAQDGTINEQLNASAMIYGHFVGGGLGTEEQAEAELLEALEHTAYDGATWQAGPTIESGLRAGMAEPYEVTDLEQDQEQEQAEDKEKSGFEQES
jgi:hypothetical protein